MHAFIATVNIVGALIVVSLLGMLWAIVAGWINRREKDAIERDMSLDLDLKMGAPPNDETVSMTRKWMAERYSSELFRNRFSDVCGWIRLAWDSLTGLVILAIFATVLWETVTSDAADAKAVWLVVPVWAALAAPSLAFSMTCKFITGRYPGQARSVRKELMKMRATTS